MDQMAPVTLQSRERGDTHAKIRLVGAGKTFQVRGTELEALKPIELDVAREEFVALVGPSGCGKSTILNLVAGLLAPSLGIHTQSMGGNIIASLLGALILLLLVGLVRRA